MNTISRNHQPPLAAGTISSSYRPDTSGKPRAAHHADEWMTLLDAHMRRLSRRLDSERPQPRPPLNRQERRRFGAHTTPKKALR